MPPWGGKAPTAAAETQRLAAAQAEITSFRAESVMDYWLGKDRAKGTVLVMGKPGAFVRLNALSPAGGSVLVDLACDGRDFVMVDFQNNCVLTGPCDTDSIARFLHVPLAPDDFFHLATGTTPLLPTADALDWDAGQGRETLTLSGDGRKQTVVLDGRDGHRDLIESRVTGGPVAWSIENKGFREITDDAGHRFRVPGKSRFQATGQKSDLLVDWKDVEVNLDLGAGQVPADRRRPGCRSAARPRRRRRPPRAHRPAPRAPRRRARRPRPDDARAHAVPAPRFAPPRPGGYCRPTWPRRSSRSTGSSPSSAPSGASCARSTACRSRSRAGRPSAWSASRAAASRSPRSASCG